MRVDRAWLLVPGALAMLAGVDAGLQRFGLAAPVRAAHLPDVHGPLMVLGFLGTVIALERAVALRHPLGYAAPALLGAGALALVLPGATRLGQVLLLDGTLALVALLVALWRRRADDTVAVEALAATLAALAALLWIRLDAAVVVPLLVSFVVLTIIAERVELARVHLPAGATRSLSFAAAAVAATALAAVLFPVWGSRVFGLALLGLAAWMAPQDVARRTIRSTGVVRFTAAAMLAGYAWLGVAGAAWVAAGRTGSSAAYDVVVHAVFLGFAMSMVLAHAPTIIPAVVRRRLPYRSFLWVPLVLLHTGLAVRVAGDLLGQVLAAHAGAWATAAALVTLPLSLLACALAGRRRSREPVAPPRHQPERSLTP